MKICLAQTQSVKGAVQSNIANHLNFVQQGIACKADLIVFPELSVTNYEPTLANKCAVQDIAIPPFITFQSISNQHQISIGIGMPTRTNTGIHISMLIFQPHKKGQIYSKQLLHQDELPFFAAGTQQAYFFIKKQKIAVGICYETLQETHFKYAVQNGAVGYVASVAKSEKGIEKAYTHFPKMAKKYKIPVLMANCIGKCDDFQSIGKSAVWDANGNLLAQLDMHQQGILMYDLYRLEF